MRAEVYAAGQPAAGSGRQRGHRSETKGRVRCVTLREPGCHEVVISSTCPLAPRGEAEGVSGLCHTVWVTRQQRDPEWKELVFLSGQYTPCLCSGGRHYPPSSRRRSLYQHPAKGGLQQIAKSTSPARHSKMTQTPWAPRPHKQPKKPSSMKTTAFPLPPPPSSLCRTSCPRRLQR